MRRTLCVRKVGLRFKEIDLVITATAAANCTFHFPSFFGFRLSYYFSLLNNIYVHQITVESLFFIQQRKFYTNAKAGF